MKYNNVKSILAALLLLASASAAGQSADGSPRSPLRWRCTAGNMLLNHNPATATPLRLDSLPYARDYTLVVAYKPVADTEATVWQLAFPDSSMRALTTLHIVSDSSRVRYAGLPSTGPAVSTFRQSAPDSVAPYMQLEANPDSLLAVAELLYFDHRLGNAALRRFQTELAIRYGITLGPVDYIDAAGTPVWTYRDNRDFHHRIAGIAHDTLYGLHQLRSRSEEPGGLLTLAADSLRPGEYLLCGDNDGALAFEYDGATELLGRQWKLQGQNMEERLFSVTINTRDLPLPTDSLVLLVCDEVYLPAAVSTDEVRYDHVYLPSDTCRLQLARGPLFWQVAMSQSRGGAHTTEPTVILYPNPTTGHFSLEVRDAEQVQATVYNMQGVVEASFSDSGRSRYLFSGTLPSGNAYFVTVVTESHTRTMKITVK